MSVTAPAYFIARKSFSRRWPPWRWRRAYAKAGLLGRGRDDLDLEAGTLRVHRQLQRLDGESRLVELKTDTSRRTLALPAVAVEALLAHRARQNEARLLLGPR